MTIFFYKGLTRNPEIGNTPIWVLTKIWRLECFKDTKFDTNVSNEMLQNAAKCQGYSFCRFWVIQEKPTGVKLPPPPSPTQIRVNTKILLLPLPSERSCTYISKYRKFWCYERLLQQWIAVFWSGVEEFLFKQIISFVQHVYNKWKKLPRNISFFVLCQKQKIILIHFKLTFLIHIIWKPLGFDIFKWLERVAWNK